MAEHDLFMLQMQGAKFLHEKKLSKKKCQSFYKKL